MGNVKSIKKNKNCHQLVAAYRVSESAESSPSLLSPGLLLLTLLE